MEGLDSLGLMIAALKRADLDAGSGWLAGADSVAVLKQISLRKDNPLAQKVAARLWNLLRPMVAGS